MKERVAILCLGACLGLSAVTAVTTGCAPHRYSRSTGEYIDDKALVSRVHGALRDNPEYKFKDVGVSVFRGTVQLNGFVNTRDQKELAANIARQVAGVREVDNNITVKESLSQNR